MMIKIYFRTDDDVPLDENVRRAIDSLHAYLHERGGRIDVSSQGSYGWIMNENENVVARWEARKETT